MLSVTILLLLLTGGVRLERSVDPIVTTYQGNMRGTTMTSRSGRTFHAFLGIPYAAPPVGELRFKAPEPPQPWGNILNATQDGPMCMQKNYLEPNPRVQGQEDCLYLNVYTPDLLPKVPLEVIVNIHGGGFFSGTGASYAWGPQYLLDKDVVLVTFNYRLGALGFLSTADNIAPGNFGLKDQVAALHWVQNNIAAFGGNPNCVTIFGQSAGGTSVHLHILSPLSAGLFHRAISQSGTALNAYAWPTDSLFLARRQAAYVGCNPDDNTADMVACLRRVDGKTLVDSGDNFKLWSIDPLDVFVPAVEHGPDAFLPANPFDIIESGQFTRVPWMAGVVTEEGLIRGASILTNRTLLEDLNQHLPVLGPRLFEINKSAVGRDEIVAYIWDRMVRFYLGNQSTITDSSERGFLNMLSDRAFIHGVHKSAQLHHRAGHRDLFLYHFNYRGLYSFTSVFANTTKDFGVSHCDDLIYMFRQPLLFPDWPPGHPDLQISEMIIQLLTDFAKYGHPTPDIKQWESGASDEKAVNNIIWDPVLSGKHLNYMELSAGPNVTMKQNWFKQRMDFWDTLPLVENESQLVDSDNLLDLIYNYFVYLVRL
ncbi:venom carboxylesterase-6-like [Zootermopsis nevadensis]|uniref:Carboxylic ester hydrolase n=1 Tax=Zootermopsis nevadensis TaxID=136037 RepID=A0A067R8Q8_ZOONE|nr:venom carboxylesterase-6-like [Zootermopsis nevadensis]XP_021920726.1 venom carboxylesterase-6-like [Zootermopsis nevadensis]XP_021920727.1 venom carboxylesterase-6-like [Zootermopsis nevadensis]XP_021920728.1 venom carboxylesterase-6-like [Zootermopsis nevadensis]KDR18975.1 Esterase FE4 [Zootermopsis nevadensis]